MKTSTPHSSVSGLDGRRLLLAASAALILSSALPGAAASAAVTSGNAGSRTGTISGRITGDGHPLPGQCAEAYNAATRKVVFGTADRNGNYRITHLKAGKYQVQFAPGIYCANPGNWLEQWYPNRTSLNPPDHPVLVRVRANEDTAGINGHLKKGAQISGVVHSRSGRPLSQICVDVVGMLPHNSTVAIGQPTNRRGGYATHGLFPGRYTVEFTNGCGNPKKYAIQWWLNAASRKKATVIKITGPAIATGVNATLRLR
jgi:hypothetical protein